MEQSPNPRRSLLGSLSWPRGSEPGSYIAAPKDGRVAVGLKGTEVASLGCPWVSEFSHTCYGYGSEQVPRAGIVIGMHMTKKNIPGQYKDPVRSPISCVHYCSLVLINLVWDVEQNPFIRHGQNSF